MAFCSLRSIVEAHPEISNQYALVHWGGHHYAEGVCGTNYFDRVILASPTSGWIKKGDCKKSLLPEVLKMMTKFTEGRFNGYEHIGRRWQKVKAFKISHILEHAGDFNWGYASLYCSYVKDGKCIEL